MLILDDFAMRELTAPQAEDLDELVSARTAAGRSLVLTSNRAPPGGPGERGYLLNVGRYQRPYCWLLFGVVIQATPSRRNDHDRANCWGRYP